VLRIETIKELGVAKQVAVLLEKENTRLHKRNEELVREVASLKGLDATRQLELEMARLQAQMELLQRKMFCASSEKRNGEEKKENGEQAKERRGHGPKEQPELPSIEVKHPLPEDKRVCESCGGILEEWEGQFEESEEITVVERQFVMRKHLRQKYRCRCGGCVKTAPAPDKLIPGGRYSTEFAVEVATQKYLDHLPLERQARIMKREGLEVDSQTLWDQIWALCRIYEPTYEKIRKYILEQQVIHGDETPWYLLKKGGREKWYAWAAACHDAVFFNIDRRRSAEAAGELYGGYEGTLMVDGYKSYKSMSNKAPPGKLRLVFCWAHARRKFVDCEADYPLECKAALDMIRDVYAVENESPEPWKLEGEERKAAFALRARLRDEKSRPLIAKIHAWAMEQVALPESTFRGAVEYMLGHWKGLTVFLDDPKVPLDNNLVERTIRGPVIGRKNHYGSKSIRGTKAAAIFYSLVETAKLQGAEPKAYLLALAQAALKSPGAALLPREIR
jgi:transposase